MEINKVYNEPCLETIRKMPDEFLDSVITSPPYWQLRDYGYDGQWGLEPTYKEYLEHLWEMMDEIYRVLKPSGTVWINLGDTYSGNGNTKEPNKCLLLIPHRFAIGCIDRGWILRNDIIWGKRNGMPESVTDRFSKKHEYIFFMVKSEKYYFDLDSIRDKVKAESLKRYEYDFSGNKGDIDRELVGYRQSKGNKTKYGDIFNEALHRQGMNKDRGNNIVEKRPKLPSQQEFVDFIRKIDMNLLDRLLNLSLSVYIPKTKIEHWYRKDTAGFSYPSVDDWNKIKKFYEKFDDFELINQKMIYVEYETDDINKNAHKGKNCGDVADFWDKKPYSVIEKDFRNPYIEVRNLPDHNELRKYLSDARKLKGITIQEIEDIFGTQAPHHWFEKDGSYPTKEDWILLKDILQFDETYDNQMTEVEIKSGLKQNNPKGKNSGDVADFWDITTKPSSNNHYAAYNDELLKKPVLAGCPEGGLIYDPFMGTGTTAMVAHRSKRNYIGSEMSVEYIKIFNKNMNPLIQQQQLF